jgi:hypothetical protein
MDIFVIQSLEYAGRHKGIRHSAGFQEFLQLPIHFRKSILALSFQECYIESARPRHRKRTAAGKSKPALPRKYQRTICRKLFPCLFQYGVS